MWRPQFRRQNNLKVEVDFIEMISACVFNVGIGLRFSIGIIDFLLYRDLQHRWPHPHFSNHRRWSLYFTNIEISQGFVGAYLTLS